MKRTIEFILSMSVVVPLIIAIVRRRNMDKTFYPFIYNLMAALLVEVLIGAQHDKVVATKIINVFSLVDFCLFAWMFHNWGLFNYNKRHLYTILAMFATAWAAI